MKNHIERARRRQRLALYVLCGLLTAFLVLTVIVYSPQGRAQAAPPSSTQSRELFTRRILPLFRSEKPSTCAECHLSGVDLKDYLRPTEQGTFASLRDQGLIDLKKPEQSRILRLIRMSTPKTPLLTQKARDLEYAAFRDWIVSATNNPTMRALPSTLKTQRARPKAPDEVIRHTRADTLLASFARNVYSQEGRCMGCHRAGAPANNENVKKYGTRVAWFAPDDPEETMRRVISQNLVNVNAPEQSLLLLKPLNKVPHGGGVKFLYGDGGYKLFRAWIEDYAKSVRGAYLSVKNLPPPPTEALYYTESILNVKNAPGAWANHLLRVDAYSWEDNRNAWSKRPVATGDRQLGPNGETNVLMFLAVPVGSAEERSARKNAQLAQGRYLLKYYVDLNGRIEQDYKLPTDSPEFYRGQQEVTAAWGRGWGSMTQIVVNPK